MRYGLTAFIQLAIFWWAGAQAPFWQAHPLGEHLEGVRPNLLHQREGGFIWLGSEKGLIRYDGQQFELFDRADSLQLGPVSAIYATGRGRLWVGCQSGAIYYLEPGSTLQPWLPEEGNPAVPITGFAEDARGQLWFSTYGEGLYCWNGKRLYNFDMDDGLLGGDIYTLTCGQEGQIWAGTDRGINICALDNHGRKQVQSITKADGLPDDIVRTILPTTAGGCWVGFYDGGLAFVRLDDWCIEIPVQNWEAGTVNALALVDGRELWVGTEGRGVWRYSFSDQRLRAVGEAKFGRAKIHGLHKDAEGNIWVLSNTEGLYSTNRQFEFIQHAPANIQAVLVDRSGKLWVGTQSGLYSYREDADGPGAFQALAGLGQANIISLLEDDFGLIWAGTFGEGIHCFDPQSGKRRQLTEREGLANGNILSMASSGGKLWLATLGGAIEIDNRQNVLDGAPLLIKHYGRESGLGTNFIYTVFVDSQGRTWFGTDGKGLALLSEGRILNFSSAGDIPIKSVYSIAEDQRGHLWFSTPREGVFEYDGNKFTQLALKEGIRNLSITGLATDELGRILIMHPAGIDLLDPAGHHLIYYDRTVGIEQAEPGLNAFCSDAQGNIWIGTQQGLIRYTPLREALRIHPSTQLLGVSANFQPIGLASGQVLPHHQNSLAFDYVGLWYTAPASVRYRYRLEGFDHDWIYSADRRAVYSSLPPGHYTFQLSATENDAFGPEPLLSYAFTIRRPFWLQWWFFLLAGSFLFGSVYWWLKKREQNFKREALLIREKVESQYEALKSQINPHFLFNSFNTLITIIEENPRLAVEYVEQLSDFYRSILQYREKEVIPLTEELGLVRNYAFLLQKRYGDSFQLRIAAQVPNALVAPLTLQMLVENAVKHNVISKARPLSVAISTIGEEYIEVRNNRQPKLAAEKSTGFGLQSIAKRYALLAERALQIEESETTFAVRIPLLKSS